MLIILLSRNEVKYSRLAELLKPTSADVFTDHELVDAVYTTYARYIMCINGIMPITALIPNYIIRVYVIWFFFLIEIKKKRRL